MTRLVAALLAAVTCLVIVLTTPAEAHARCDHADHTHLVIRNWALHTEHWRYLRDDVRWDYRLHRSIVWSIWSVDGRTVSQSRCS